MTHQHMKGEVGTRHHTLLSSASNGAWIGFACGVLSLGFVAVARFLVPQAGSKPNTVSLPILALLYLAVGPGLGFFGGALRHWLPGRLGKFIVATAIGAVGAAIGLPFLPGAKYPWGPTEYGTLVICAISVGLFFGLKRD
jgi:hypothetical protein